MAKKLLLLLLALSLLLSSCSYQVVEDPEERTIFGAGQTAYALEADAPQEGGEHTLTGDIARALRWIGEQLRRFARWVENGGGEEGLPQGEETPLAGATPAPTPVPTPVPTEKPSGNGGGAPAATAAPAPVLDSTPKTGAVSLSLLPLAGFGFAALGTVSRKRR